MRIILCIAFALLASCSTTHYNETVFPYEYNPSITQGKAIKKVVLAPVSLGVPAPSYLSKAEQKTRVLVRQYLQSKGFEVLPDYQFANAWQQAIRSYGDIYDPTTGKIDTQAWRSTMIAVSERLRTTTDAQAIIFADLFVHKVQHSPGFNHDAKWYGITRKPSFRGTSEYISAEFNWVEPIDAASLMITIYSVDLNRIFTSRAGIDTLDQIDNRVQPGSFTRKRKFLSRDDYIQEGIALAFHPFIPVSHYPQSNETKP